MKDEVGEGTSGRTGLVSYDSIMMERNASSETHDNIRARAEKLLRRASRRALKTNNMAESDISPNPNANIEVESLIQGSEDHSNTTQDELKALKKEVSQLKNEVGALVEKKLQGWTLKIGGYDQDVTVAWEESVLPLKTREEDIEGGAWGNVGYTDSASNESVAPQSNDTETRRGRERDLEFGGSSVVLGEEKVEEGEEM